VPRCLAEDSNLSPFNPEADALPIKLLRNYFALAFLQMKLKKKKTNKKKPNKQTNKQKNNLAFLSYFITSLPSTH
jgi:hypothetical protein